jgi:hypothetical protein
VDTLVQQFRTGMMATHGDNRFKVMTYQYDLISGKVNQVHYQPGQPDQYYHRYAYDAENRITDVYTTTNKALIGSDVLEEHEAYYAYNCIEPLFPGQFRCLKLVGLSFYRVTVLDFLSRPIPVFFCPTNHAF